MPRGILISVPAQEFEWYKQALELLANDVITDEEAGQRGTKVSVFIRMIIVAYIRDGFTTAELLRKLKP